VDHVVHNLPDRVNVILCNTEEDPVKELLYLDVLMEKRIDGLIVAPAGDNEEYFGGLVERSFPLVLVDRALPTVDADTVLVDNFSAATEVVRHLIDRGHRRIAVLRATLHATSIAERIHGYRRAMSDAGVAATPELIVESASDIDAAHVAGRRILDLDPLPDAVFCTNNFMTLGMMRALHERGLRCPEDVAIAGFDDFQWADSYRPRITAVAQPGFEMGQEAARLLVGRIQKTLDGPAIHRTLGTSLIVRESSG
jgi:DNA-binding LacI/PurR family transcriptional regulator